MQTLVIEPIKNQREFQKAEDALDALIKKRSQLRRHIERTGHSDHSMDEKLRSTTEKIEQVKTLIAAYENNPTPEPATEEIQQVRYESDAHTTRTIAGRRKLKVKLPEIWNDDDYIEVRDMYEDLLETRCEIQITLSSSKKSEGSPNYQNWKKKAEIALHKTERNLEVLKVRMQAYEQGCEDLHFESGALYMREKIIDILKERDIPELIRVVSEIAYIPTTLTEARELKKPDEYEDEFSIEGWRG